MELSRIQEEARNQRISVDLILKEKVQLVILEYFFREGYFSHLAFQGGTCLRFAYGGVRYSEDLDFVLRKVSDPFFGNITRKLQSFPQYVDKCVPFAKKTELKTQKDTATFKRYVLTFHMDEPKPSDKTRIEIANVPSRENHIVMIENPGSPGRPAVCVETPREILSDKLMVFGARNFVKGRDIWDIFFLVDTLKTAIDDQAKGMARKKISDYRLKTTNFRSVFEKNLSSLERSGERILKVEMDRFLPQAYRHMYQAQYQAISEKVLEVLKEFYDGL